MRQKLTPKTIEHLRSTGSRFEVWDQVLPGFGVRVAPNGRKTWFVMSRVNGKQKRIKVGTYPALSLGQARDQARTILRDIQTGNYAAPRFEVPTLGETIPLFIERYAKPKNRGWKETETVLRKFAAIHGKPLNEIKRADVVKVLDEIVANGTPIRANRCLAAIKKLFAWSLDRGMVEVNPVAGLKPPGKEQSRDRVLTDGELQRFWKKTERMGYPFGHLCQLLLITAQRRGEVTNMRWSHIDAERATWTIPAERSKNGRAHQVPLPPSAIELLEHLPRFLKSDFVFTTTGTGPVCGFGRVKRRLDKAVGSDDWRIHDLRRTAASGMARLGVAPHVIEKVLNHVSGQISGVAAVYNRHGYDAEKRAALEQWAVHICDLVRKTPRQNVASVHDHAIRNRPTLDITPRGGRDCGQPTVRTGLVG